MTRTTIATVLATALTAALLSGCGGSGDPSASGSSMPNVEPAPSSSASSPAPSPSSSSAPSSPASSPKPSTSVEMAGAPGVPKAARHHTKAGAEAFVRHYLKLVNVTGVAPKPGRLEPLAGKGCVACQALSETVADMASKRERYSSEPINAGKPKVIGASGNVVDLRVSVVQRPVKRVGQGGTVVERAPKGTSSSVFRLKWTRGGWRVSSIFNDKR